MKFSIVAIFLVALINGGLTKPSGIILDYQDNLGQYRFGYSAPHQARSEVRSLDGVTRGSYSYVDGAGLIQSTDYIADGQHGFRVSATNLPQAPVPVQETPEVAAARAAHLLAVEEATRSAMSVQQPVQESADSITVLSKSSAEPETAPKDEVASPMDKPEEPMIEPVAEAEKEAAPEIQTPEALAEAAAEADAEEKKEAELKEKEKEKEKENENEKEKEKEEEKEIEETKEKGRSVEDPASVAPVIASPAALLPVPLIPVNFDLPTISAYSLRPAGAKADQTTLPQSTPVQGVITPASTTLKTLPGSPQLVAIAPQIALSGEPGAASANIPASALSGLARDFGQYDRARAVFAPVNVIPLGYDPTISPFFRYAPFPYVTYNIL